MRLHGTKRSTWTPAARRRPGAADLPLAAARAARDCCARRPADTDGGSVGAVLIAAGAFFTLRAVWQWERTHLVVTTEKVYLLNGTLHRRSRAVRLQMVDAVEVDQSLVGQLFGYGTVVVGPLKVGHIARPERGLQPRREPRLVAKTNTCSIRSRWLDWLGYGSEELVIHGAREHNLQDVDVRLPRNKLITSPGSPAPGSRRLAFDTIYAEGQRRYVESLSAYARQFLQMMEKPDVDSIDGLTPRDLDRPEDDEPQPALHRRHGDRDLRLPAPALRAGRQAALPGLRPPDRRPEPGGDRRPGPPARGGDEVHRQRARRARPQGRVQGPARGAPRRRLHAREGRRRGEAARGADRARQEVQAHDRGRGRPARA